MLELPGKNRILIVEDSLFHRKVLADMLSDDYTVGQASTAMEFFSMVDTFAPDLILLDILLPDANGFDILEELKRETLTSRIPVVIISGLDATTDEERGFLLGAVDYIKKPFKNTIVKARIATQIKLVNQMRAIEEMSFMDSLTHIQNRRAFDERLRREWDRASQAGSALGLLMIDVDEFKRYNDNYGHLQGDVTLQIVAFTIKSTLGQLAGNLFRYGGEEFAVLLPGAELPEAAAIAENIRIAVAETQIFTACTDGKLRVTLSIGVASERPAFLQCPQDLISLADAHLYEAKAQGRNQVQYQRTPVVASC